MGFESLDQAINIIEPPRTPSEVAFFDEDLSDESALAIVLADTDTAEKFLQSKNLITSLDQSDDLVRAYVKPRMWPNGKPRSNLGMPVVLEAVEKILPAIHMALWGSGKLPFSFEPVGRTKPEAARAKEKLIAWAFRQAGVKEQMRLTLKTALTYGFTVGAYGWEDKERQIKSYKMKDDDSGDVEPVINTVTTSQPTYECLDLRQVLIDPGCKTQDIRKGAKYVIKQVFVTANDLDDLRDDAGYKNVPSREQLAFILVGNGEASTDSLSGSKTNAFRDLQAEPVSKPTSSDPLQQPLEILEYWSNDRVITVLQRKIVIRNEENEFGKLPNVSCAFIDVLGSAWGFGIAKLLSGEQRFQQGVMNSWIDSLALILNPTFQLMKGIGAGTQQVSLSPGKVINEAGELKPLVIPSVSTEAMTAIGSSEERASRRVGANGGSDMPNQAMRTAQGVNAFSGDVIQRLQYWLEIFLEMVFIPVIEAFIELCAAKLQPKQINEILSDVDGKAYQGDILDVYNSKCNVVVSAGTKLTTKQAASQLAPMLIQLVSAQPVQDSFTQSGIKFNYAEFIAETVELMGWDINALIIPMTPDDTQRAQQNNAALIKAQQDQQTQAQQHADDLENIDAKGTAQAGVAVVRQIIKSHSDEAQSAMDAMRTPGSATSGQ